MRESRGVRAAGPRAPPRGTGCAGSARRDAGPQARSMEPTSRYCPAAAYPAASAARIENGGPARESGRRAGERDGAAPGCAGCGEALAARHVAAAAMRATGGNVIAVDAVGCFEIVAASGPGARPPIPRIRALEGSAAAVAAGVAAAVAVKGRAEVRVIAEAGGVATDGIGFGCISGMFERDDDVLYVCYDDAPWLDAGAPPDRAARAAAPGGARKCLPLIAMAHRIPYVATASVADPRDLGRKVARAIGVCGARYLHVHTPCPPAWGADPGDTVRLAQLAVDTGLFPLFEAEDGAVVGRTPIGRRVPVAEFLGPQARFAGLFGAAPDAARLAAIEATADRNVARFGLAA